MITVERLGKFLDFKKDGNWIYDININTCNGFECVTECLETKQWATSEIIEECERLAD